MFATLTIFYHRDTETQRKNKDDLATKRVYNCTPFVLKLNELLLQTTHHSRLDLLQYFFNCFIQLRIVAVEFIFKTVDDADIRINTIYLQIFSFE